MKPRLKHIRVPYLLGIVPCAPMWVCESRDGFGAGPSKEAAYEAWEKDRPKTMAGVILRRAGNSLLDMVGL